MAEGDHLWDDNYRDLARWCGISALPDSSKGRMARAVLDARLALEQVEAARAMTEAAREGAEASRASAKASTSTARATWLLVAATWALAISTVVLAIVA